MQLDYSVLFSVLLWATLLTTILWFAYGKFVYSIFDPLFTYLYTTAFSSVFVLNVVSEEKYIAHYFLCHFFLYLGFVSFQKNNERNLSLDGHKNIVFKFDELYILKLVTYILFFTYVVSNLFTFFTRGSAFFSDDPYARETNFENGFGFFRRINWGIGSFLTASLIILFIKKRKRLFAVMLLILAFFTVLEGAKSSLLRILVIISAMLEHPYFKQNFNITAKIKRYTPIGIFALLLSFFTVLAKESSGNDAFLAFINRLLAGADAVLYFYAPQNEYLLTTYHPWDFVMYFLNPILGFLHIVPYVEPFGSVTVGNTQLSSIRSDIYLAPNTPFYLEGQIFFGYYGAFIYSFFLGSLIAIVRNIFFNMTNGSYFTLAFSCAIFFHSAPLANEVSLFVKACLDTIIFAIPAYLLVSFATTSRIKIRYSSFSTRKE